MARPTEIATYPAPEVIEEDPNTFSCFVPAPWGDGSGRWYWATVYVFNEGRGWEVEWPRLVASGSDHVETGFSSFAAALRRAQEYLQVPPGASVN